MLYYHQRFYGNQLLSRKESTLEKIQTCEANPMSSYTQQVQKHTANSFCVYTKCEQNEYSKLETYVGPNASEEFFKYLRLETQRIYDLQTKNCPHVPIRQSFCNI